jgi:hypothetical protein
MDSSDFVKDGWQAGLWKIIPSGATNGTVSADGDVTIGSAVPSVTVSGAFSSEYVNYKILYSGVDASVAGAEMRLTLNNSTGSTYRYAGQSFDYIGTNTFVYDLGVAYMIVGFTGTNIDAFSEITVFAPFLSTIETGLNAKGGRRNNNFNGTGFDVNAVSHTGFTLTPSSGTLTGGTISVYGYNQ